MKYLSRPLIILGALALASSANAQFGLQPPHPAGQVIFAPGFGTPQVIVPDQFGGFQAVPVTALPATQFPLAPLSAFQMGHPAIVPAPPLTGILPTQFGAPIGPFPLTPLGAFPATPLTVVPTGMVGAGPLATAPFAGFGALTGFGGFPLNQMGAPVMVPAPGGPMAPPAGAASFGGAVNPAPAAH
jgi:hypothetical protein